MGLTSDPARYAVIWRSGQYFQEAVEYVATTVNEHLQRGWTPAGDLQIVVRGGKFYVAQALWRAV